MGGTTTGPTTVADRQRTLRAIELRSEGHTWQEVADLAGYTTKQGAQKSVANLLERSEKRNVEEYRRTFDAQLAWLWEETARRIGYCSDNAPTGYSNLAQTAVRIIERRVKLHGVDAAEKTEQTVVVKTELDHEIEKLVDRLTGKTVAPAEPTVEVAP